MTGTCLGTHWWTIRKVATIAYFQLPHPNFVFGKTYRYWTHKSYTRQHPWKVFHIVKNVNIHYHKSYTRHTLLNLSQNKCKSHWHHIYMDGWEMIFTFSHILYAEQNRILKTVSGLHALKPSLPRTEQLVTIRPSPSINPEFQLLMQNRHFPRSIMASRLL